MKLMIDFTVFDTKTSLHMCYFIQGRIPHIFVCTLLLNMNPDIIGNICVVLRHEILVCKPKPLAL